MSKLLIVYDVEGWAFHRWAAGIQKFAPSKYKVDICSQHEFSQDRARNLRYIRSCDGICCCSWTEAPFPYGANFYTTILAHHGCTQRQGSDWLHWPRVAATNLRNEKTAAQKLPRFDRVICTNRMLYEWAIDQGYCVDVKFASVGVDSEIFKPKSRPEAGKLIAGWCGQSPEGIRTTKGYYEILKPLLANTKDWAAWSVLTTQASDRDRMTATQMREWYGNLDVFVMTSISEGVPNPIFEAASCGVPVVGTDVGDIRSLIKGEDAGCIVPKYENSRQSIETIAAIHTRLAELKNDRSLLAQMGKAARKAVEERLSWKVRAKQWCELITNSSN